MPFTPFHMGPGILVKAVLQGSFSLMVFGWTQVVMDIQPLIVLMTGMGHLHGFTHTYPGATLLGIFSALSGKYLSELGLALLGIAGADGKSYISWRVAMVSACLGAYSHVLLDSLMHADIQPFYPFSLANDLLHAISVKNLHKLCLYSGLVGAGLFYLVQSFVKQRSRL